MVYVIRSNSFRVLNDKIQELIENIPDRKYFSLDMDEIEDVIIDASYVGMFNDARAIIVREVNYFGGKAKYEDIVNKLINFINNMDESITLILVCNNLNKTKDTTKQLLKCKNLEFIDLNIKDEELDKVVKDYSSNNNIRLDSKALGKLKENTVNNVDLILNEIDKLSLIDKDITYKLVVEFGSNYIIPRDNIDEVDYNDISFKFVNSLAEKKFKDAFAYFDKIVERGDDMYSLIGLINSQFSNIYMVKEAMSYGLSDDKIAEALGYKNVNRVYVMKRNGNLYTLEDLAEVIVNLSDVDVKIKLGMDPVIGLKEFILSI